MRRDGRADDTSQVRGPIADSLIAERTLIGLNESQVEALLGPPTGTLNFDDWDLVYYLGPARMWMPIDPEFLVIKLDDRGLVTEAKVVVG